MHAWAQPHLHFRCWTVHLKDANLHPNEAVDFLVEAAAAGKPGSCQAVPVMKGECLCNNM